MRRLLDFLSPERATRLAFLIFLVVSPAYYWCHHAHYCMAGHLQHPEEVGPFTYANDVLWILGFALSTILAFRSDVTFRYVCGFVLGVLFLFISDPRGLGGILELPVQIALGGLSLACLFGWIE